MKAQRGFTLIELVVVIIVLGILAVTAAPKFIDLQSDARAATLQGAKGALQGANAMVYAKAAINGVEDKDCTPPDTGSAPAGCAALKADTGVDAVYGAAPASKSAVTAVADFSASEWAFDESVDGKVFITPSGVAAKTGVLTADGDACQLIYSQASKSGDDITPASYIVVKKGC